MSTGVNSDIVVYFLELATHIEVITVKCCPVLPLSHDNIRKTVIIQVKVYSRIEKHEYLYCFFMSLTCAFSICKVELQLHQFIW